MMTFDAIVYGQRPGAELAAIRLAQRGRKVARVSGESGGFVGWTNIAAFSKRGLNLAETLTTQNHRGVRSCRLVSSDLTRTTEIQWKTPPAVILNSAPWEKKLRIAAKRAGAALFDCQNDSPRIDRQEDGVFLHIGDESLEAKCLLTSQTLPAASDKRCLWWEGRTTREIPDLTAIWNGQRIGTVILHLPGRRWGVLVMDIPPEKAHSHLQALQRANLLPEGIPPEKGPRYQWFQSSSALTRSTHVGKRELVFGSAGGFFSSISGEELYPELWSARCVADCLDAALDATHFQDALARFDTEGKENSLQGGAPSGAEPFGGWRGELAGYIADPGENLEMLFPMIFNNPRLAKTFARSLLCGTNF